MPVWLIKVQKSPFEEDDSGDDLEDTNGKRKAIDQNPAGTECGSRTAQHLCIAALSKDVSAFVRTVQHLDPSQSNMLFLAQRKKWVVQLDNRQVSMTEVED